MTGCVGSGVRSGVSVGPRLTSARLGSIRSAMTYDGDWLGGVSAVEELERDLELAARRGVEFVIDLRARYSREIQPLESSVAAAGMELVVVPRGSEGQGRGAFGVSAESVDAVRRILNAPGRRRSLLLDETGTLSSMIYAIHLTVDEGIAEAEALRGARASGLGEQGVGFVRAEVRRIREER